MVWLVVCGFRWCWVLIVFGCVLVGLVIVFISDLVVLLVTCCLLLIAGFL